MLELWEFIKNNSNWREVLTAPPYNLKIDENDKYILFKYNQRESDFSLPVVRDARGVIFRKSDWKIVRYAYYKFFNIGETYAANIEWASTVSTDKIDGSLISLWYDEDWHISTNGLINAYDAPLYSGFYDSFGSLFDAAAQRSGLDFEKLNKNYCYTFELVAPESIVVVRYPEMCIYHTLTRDLRTLEEVNEDIGIRKPEEHKFYKQEDYINFVKSLEDKHVEGIVVKDRFGNRVKMKTQWYFKGHLMAKNNSINFEKALDIILANEQSEFLSYFPNYKPFFEMVISTYDEASEEITKIADTVRNWIIDHPVASRRSFAEWVNQSDFGKYKPTAFAIYDGKFYRDLKECKTAKDFMKLYRIGDNIYETMEKNSREEI